MSSMYWLVKRFIKFSRPMSRRKILNYVLESEIERHLFHKLKRHGYCPADIIDVGTYEGDMLLKKDSHFAKAFNTAVKD